jgi:hypothetical protein
MKKIEILNIPFAALMAYLGLYLLNIPLTLVSGSMAFLLSFPYKINGNTFSLFGGFNCEGDRNGGNVFSLIGVIQYSKNGSVYCLVAAGFQKARNNCRSVIGLVIASIAGSESAHLFGVSLYQNGYSRAAMAIGISFCMHSQTIVHRLGINVIHIGNIFEYPKSLTLKFY